MLITAVGPSEAIIRLAYMLLTHVHVVHDYMSIPAAASTQPPRAGRRGCGAARHGAEVLARRARRHRGGRQRLRESHGLRTREREREP